MNLIHLCGEINEELFEAFVNEFKTLDQEQPLTIYLNSEGGSLPYTEAMIDMIDNFPSQVNIYATELVASGGLLLFLKTNSRKFISNGTFGLWHFASTGYESKDCYSDSRFKESSDANELKINEKIIKLMNKLEVPQELINKVLDHKDCYISSDELFREAALAEQFYYFN